MLASGLWAPGQTIRNTNKPLPKAAREGSWDLNFSYGKNTQKESSSFAGKAAFRTISSIQYFTHMANGFYTIQKGYAIVCSCSFGAFQPTSGHLHGFLPSLIHMITVLLGKLWLEHHVILALDRFELFDVLPNACGKSGCHSGSQGGSFSHDGPMNRNIDDVCLGLWSNAVI
jgi:hypothetical protein